MLSLLAKVMSIFMAIICAIFSGNLWPIYLLYMIGITYFVLSYKVLFQDRHKLFLQNKMWEKVLIGMLVVDKLFLCFYYFIWVIYDF